MTRLRPRSLSELPLGFIVVFATLLIVAVFGPQMAPHDPGAAELAHRLSPPVFAGGTWSYPLGTDDAGRDILSRLLVGARVSLIIAVLSLLIAGILGTTIGLISGYFGGRLDAFLMRVADLTISYPVLLLALVLAIVRGPSAANVVLTISFVLWARFARIVRGEALVIRQSDYVALARIAGAGAGRIMRKHILPNLLNTVMVLASLQIGWVIVAQSSLSFLGAGVPLSQPEWGSMAALGRDYVVTAWWISGIPGLAIVVTVLAVNLFGDWLRERLDPTLSQL